ncbi:pentapeptide repeat-containing protein [Paenibacillus ginsengihumi]|uniref:pentapeptide repeat-containing protein n=1 Tax=Paenibacillus ginsengihumi TaxID=431596 RepID=UPI001469DA61|nr:pentapeptide repeat-containing protein [Paenibacillus ginsengihumi]
MSTSFERTIFSECILSKTVFDYASIKHSMIRNCVEIKASFDDTDLSFANISRSDLRRASLRRANLSYAKFSNVDLTNALLDGALLYGTSFEEISGLDEVSANHIFVGTEEKPIRLDGENVKKWLLEQARG